MHSQEEGTSSVVVCSTWDCGDAGFEKRKTLHLLLSTGSTKEMSHQDWKIVDWYIRHQLKQTISLNCSLIFYHQWSACPNINVNPFHSGYGKQILWQTVKTQMKCRIRRHFIWVFTVCYFKKKTIFRDRNKSFYGLWNFDQ